MANLSNQLPASNVVDGTPHFGIVRPDGTEVCNCGDSYPCPNAARLRAEPVEPPATPETVVASATVSGLRWEVVADAMGVPRDDVERWVDQQIS